MRHPWPLPALLFGQLACGAGVDIGGTLEPPRARPSRVQLGAALDLSSLTDPRVIEALRVTEIAVGLREARVLGPHPGIPSGGYPLFERPLVLRSRAGEPIAAQFPIPDWMAKEELAVFVHLGATDELGGASVVIKGSFADGERRFLTSDDVAEPGPDGEPAKPSGGGDYGEPGPDGEPARCEGACTNKSSLAGVGAVEFELRGDDEVDLLAELESDSNLSVVVGIPASRWLDPRTVDGLLGVTPPTAKAEEPARAPTRVVLDSKADRASALEGTTALPAEPRGEYRLLDDRGLDPDAFRH